MYIPSLGLGGVLAIFALIGIFAVIVNYRSHRRDLRQRQDREQRLAMDRADKSTDPARYFLG